VFIRLRDGKYKNTPEDLQKRAVACSKSFWRQENPDFEQEKVFRILTEYEKEWLAAEHKLSKSWPEICKLFRGKFQNTANVTPNSLKKGLSTYLRREGRSMDKVRLQNRAQLDIPIVRVHQEHPKESRRFIAEKILQTEAYNGHHATTAVEPQSFRRRWKYLTDNNITIEELVDFVSQGAKPKSNSPYKNAVPYNGLRKRKCKEKTDEDGGEEDSSLTEFSEEDEDGDDRDNGEDGDDYDAFDDEEDDEEEFEELNKGFEDSDISDLSELVSDQEGSVVRSTARSAYAPAPKPASQSDSRSASRPRKS
jgi:hypothetical protein